MGINSSRRSARPRLSAPALQDTAPPSRTTSCGAGRRQAAHGSWRRLTRMKAPTGFDACRRGRRGQCPPGHGRRRATDDGRRGCRPPQAGGSAPSAAEACPHASHRPPSSGSTRPGRPPPGPCCPSGTRRYHSQRGQDQRPRRAYGQSDYGIGEREARRDAGSAGDHGRGGEPVAPCSRSAGACRSVSAYQVRWQSPLYPPPPRRCLCPWPWSWWTAPFSRSWPDGCVGPLSRDPTRRCAIPHRSALSRSLRPWRSSSCRRQAIKVSKWKSPSRRYASANAK